MKCKQELIDEFGNLVDTIMSEFKYRNIKQYKLLKRLVNVSYELGLRKGKRSKKPESDLSLFSDEALDDYTSAEGLNDYKGGDEYD